MSISEKQLVTWANQGAEAASATTYVSIKSAIESINWANDITYSIYLQGSYRNKTNIYGDSDVDVVFEVTSIFYHNISELDSNSQLLFERDFPGTGKYTLDQFKETLKEKFEKLYGVQYVQVGGKTITVLKNSGRLNCDIVCCFQFHGYSSYTLWTKNSYNKGIKFHDSKKNRWVVNFPEQHYQNGVDKNDKSRTNNNYKPFVRIVKNFRSALVDKQRITDDLAPSYFIQCLLYNVPDKCFWGGNWQQILILVLNQLSVDLTNKNIGTYICQNGIIPLFGNSPEQWDIAKATTFINQVIKLNNEG